MGQAVSKGTQKRGLPIKVTREKLIYNLTFLAPSSNSSRRTIAFTTDGVTAGSTKTLTSAQTLMPVCPWRTNWKTQNLNTSILDTKYNDARDRKRKCCCRALQFLAFFCTWKARLSSTMWYLLTSVTTPPGPSIGTYASAWHSVTLDSSCAVADPITVEAVSAFRARWAEMKLLLAYLNNQKTRTMSIESLTHSRPPHSHFISGESLIVSNDSFHEILMFKTVNSFCLSYVTGT